MTFVCKQCTQYWCSNNINKWMTSMFILYKPMEIRLHMMIIAKLCPMKFVMKWHTWWFMKQLVWMREKIEADNQLSQLVLLLFFRANIWAIKSSTHRKKYMCRIIVLIYLSFVQFFQWHVSLQFFYKIVN
jgi:hypothetical protein